MNTQIIDFLKNVSNENLVAAKENIHAVLAQKVSGILDDKKDEIKSSLYDNPSKEN